MRLDWDKAPKRPGVWRIEEWGGLLLTPLALLGAAGWMWWVRGREPQCRFLAWSGVPCPLCGGGRAWRVLLDGRVTESLRLQPLVVVIVGAAIFFFAYSLAVVLLRCPRPRPRCTSRRERGVLIAMAAGLALLNWIWRW